MKNPKDKKGVIKAIRFYKGIAKEYDYEIDLSHHTWLIIKFFIYGGLGMIMEITFSNLVRVLSFMPIIGVAVKSFTGMIFPPGIPDHFLFPWKVMYAMSSLWMVFVYGTGLSFIEWLYPKLKRIKLNIFIRGIFYAVAIVLIEFIWGWIYRLILGEFVWQYQGILVTTTLAVLPYWYIAGIAAEFICKKLHEKDLEYAFRTNYDIPLKILKIDDKH
jgi:hypothetical protein